MTDKTLVRKLKKRILASAKIAKAQNVKLGDMGDWAVLFGNIDWYIPELGLSCRGTCGDYCKGCFDEDDPSKSPCYVRKSYVRFSNKDIGIVKGKCTVKLGHAYRTLAITLFRDELLKSLDKQLTNKREKFKVIRINESGELTCYEDLEMWCKLAILHPETNFYLYTKNYPAVRKAIKNCIIPSNMYINISIWHEYGIEEFLEFKHHPQIKAFVLVDSEWTIGKYANSGVPIDMMCGAYNEFGVMNHNVTCDKCKVCYNKKRKVVGCYKH